MQVKQISVFVENKQGRMAHITNILSENNIDIRAISVADTTEFGILRLIVSDPQKACDALKAAGCTVSITNVLAVQIDDQPGGLAKIMSVLSEHTINVEYIYAFITQIKQHACVILKTSEPERTATLLKEQNIKLLTGEEIFFQS